MNDAFRKAPRAGFTCSSELESRAHLIELAPGLELLSSVSRRNPNESERQPNESRFTFGALFFWTPAPQAT